MSAKLSLPRSDLSLSLLESARGEATAHLETLQDPEEAKEFYDQTLFPLTADWIRRTAGRGMAKLVFVPVGTQPYSPILAALATPSENLVLLATEGSRPFAESVLESIIDERPRARVLSLGDGEDTVFMSRVILQESARLGSPSARSTTMDITSGLKIMSASLGAIASIKGWRQTYIRATPSRRHRHLFVQESFIELAHFRTLVGEDSRQDALALMRAGSFAAASWSLKSAAERGVPALIDEVLMAACRALYALSRGDQEAVSSLFRECARLLGGGRAADLCLAVADGSTLMPAYLSPQPSWESANEEDEREVAFSGGGLAARFLELLAQEHTL